MPTSARQSTLPDGSALPQSLLSIDGVRRRAVKSQPRVRAPRPTAPVYRQQLQAPTSARPRLILRIWKRIRLPSLLIGGVTAGMLLQQAWFGTAAIVMYGILSFILHIPSRTTFALATVALSAVCAVLVAGSNREVAHSFATYTFLLLVLGVIALGFEAKPQKRRKRRNGR